MVDPRALKAAKDGTTSWTRYRNSQAPHLPNPDLIEADLRGSDLSGADLREADLREAILRRVDLSGAHLSGVDLSGADLIGAHLSGAHLSGAHLPKADLREADLREADLREADLSGAHLREADLSEADLSEANLRRANLPRANLPEANLSEANLSEANLPGADLSGADLSGADLSGANLSGANLSGAKWNPNLPPTWPEGFNPPPNGWEGSDPSVPPDASPAMSARELNPTRVAQLELDQLAGLSRSIEPFLGTVNKLIHSGTLDDFNQARIEHADQALRLELFQNPAEPSPDLITGGFARLLKLVAPYLPPTIEDTRTEPNQADNHATQAIKHATQLGNPNPEIAGRQAADTADELGDALTSENTSEPEPELSSRQILLRHIGWVAGAATGGAVGSVELVPVFIQTMSPQWAATIGAVTGVLSYLFKTRTDRN